MMMDTAGFEKILEISKREEEERLQKLKMIDDNEQKLLNQGIRQSESYK
jgi:hypothetical protein